MSIPAQDCHNPSDIGTYLRVPASKEVKKKDKAAPKKPETPMHQLLGQSLSAAFLSALNVSQSDIRIAMRNPGHKPSPSPESSRASSDYSSSTSTLGDLHHEPTERADQSKQEASQRKDTAAKYEGCTYSLKDFSALDAFETLLAQYGSASHMGVRDPSYTFFINTTRTAALYYKVLDKIAIITGDPLCCPSEYESILADFRSFCKAHHWGVVMMAASESMADLAREKSWSSMRFGIDKIINPLANPLFLGAGGKRTIAKCRQLLKSGVEIHLYCPSYQNDPHIESQIVRIYDEWRGLRNSSRRNHQCFITVFDILALPRLMTYIYATDRTHSGGSDSIVGFAALRTLREGFHVDPFIANSTAPKGTTDLLLYAAMAFCKQLGISHLSLGFEPFPALSARDITGMPSVLTGLTRKVHKKIWEKLSLDGKKAFFQRFYPDVEQDAGLYIVYFQMPGVRHMVATTHFANVSLRAVVMRKGDGLRGR